MKCSVSQNFHSLPYPFVNLFKLDTLVFDFNFQWFSLGMEEEGVQWLEWKGYFLQPNNSTKDFVNKSAKAKNNYNRWLQCTVYIDDTNHFYPLTLVLYHPSIPTHIFSTPPPRNVYLIFFLGRLFTHYNIKWAKGVLLQPK